MERISKTSFIAKSNRQIEMYQSFRKAIEILKEIAVNYDNKKMDKRFIDKVNAIFKEKVPYVTISFTTDYNGNRQNRFKLYYNNRYIQEVNMYLDMYACESIFYPREASYIDNETFRLCTDVFIKVLDDEWVNYDNRINKLIECIEKVDEVIEKYAELRSYVEKTMATIPSMLRIRECENITCPIYIDKKAY